MYAIWVASIAVMVVLAIISEDTGAKWVFGVAAVLAAVSAVGSWWERRKRGEHESEDIDQQRGSGR